ncbi:L,D-transpeptidase [Marinobacter adhaerens]|uniref:L,D-transpeptidase n=1 Tax=Marinobacter adhaerens TaxID=1033846 RepID=A0A851HRL1_9GAMM|nr:L,D-transpeptidase [Marinobacter adhaerens]
MSQHSLNASSIDICLNSQTLTLLDEKGRSIAGYPVSTGLNGAGEQNGSGCTPRGAHYLRAMVGAGLPANTVFRARRPTGEIYTPELAASHPGRDWILSRILWLCGLEPGKNRGGNVDTFRRFIYIHGTPDTEPMGQALSHGCIRMRNDDVIELFGAARTGMPVTIR